MNLLQWPSTISDKIHIWKANSSMCQYIYQWSRTTFYANRSLSKGLQTNPKSLSKMMHQNSILMPPYQSPNRLLLLLLLLLVLLVVLITAAFLPYQGTTKLCFYCLIYWGMWFSGRLKIKSRIVESSSNRIDVETLIRCVFIKQTIVIQIIISSFSPEWHVTQARRYWPTKYVIWKIHDT